jgi:hypothetical protein
MSGPPSAFQIGKIDCFCSDGSHLTLHPPILETICDGCRKRADDACLVLIRADGTESSGGFCGDCLVERLGR